MEVLEDLLMPRTDAGAIAQIVLLLVAGVTAAVALRRRSELRLLAVGASVLLVSLAALRAAH